MLKRILLLAATCVAVLVFASPSSAFRLGRALTPLGGNPANALAALPPDPEEYDPATHCSARPKPGTVALTAWLQRNARGVMWGSYRCEKWGEGKASLHAENRAIDWHLDVDVPADRLAARRLIELLLAPDSAGTPHALARRMGVEELIWDCSYWGAGMTDFQAYGPCLNRNGDVRKHVGKTIAHRDHIHIGLSKAGAAKRTTFWQRSAGGALVVAAGGTVAPSRI